MRAFPSRLPLLLMAAALVALALFAPGAQPAQAQSTETEVWSATLTAANASPFIGCDNTVGNAACSNTAVLTDDNFTYGGVDYGVNAVYVSSGTLALRLNKTISDSLKSALTLHVGNRQFALADATLGTAAKNNDSAVWTNSGLSWSVGDTVSLRLTEPPPPPPLSKLTLRASGTLREGGGPVTVTYTLDQPAPCYMGSTINLEGTANDLYVADDYWFEGDRLEKWIEEFNEQNDPDVSGEPDIDIDYGITRPPHIEKGETTATQTIVAIRDDKDDNGETIILTAAMTGVQGCDVSRVEDEITLTIGGSGGGGGGGGTPPGGGGGTPPGGGGTPPGGGGGTPPGGGGGTPPGGGGGTPPGGGGDTPAINPVFTDATGASRSAVVSASSGSAVGDPVAASHAGNLDITYSLGGTDSAPFTIDARTGQISLGQDASLIVGQTYTVTVTAAVDTGGEATIDVTIVVVINLYDLDRDGSIDRSEAVQAVLDYQADELTRAEVVQVILLYQGRDASAALDEEDALELIAAFATESELLATYDADTSDHIDLEEVSAAIDDYFGRAITLEQVNIVIDLYFAPAIAARSTRSEAVTALLIDRYDLNDSGVLEKDEALEAIDDYLFGDYELLTKVAVLDIIDAYLFA